MIIQEKYMATKGTEVSTTWSFKHIYVLNRWKSRIYKGKYFFANEMTTHEGK